MRHKIKPNILLFQKYSCSKVKFNNRHDMIGPPDKISNLRPVVFCDSPNETALQKEYKKLRNDIQEWNQRFWSTHNKSFHRERDEFIASNKKADQSTLNADEMSVFYKSFLDKNWQMHTNYNISWYTKNVSLLYLAIKVQLEKMYIKFK